MIARNYHNTAIADILAGFANWRIWWLLGIGDVRQRYSRSVLGQFWVTLSMAFFILSVSTVYAAILNQPNAEFVKFIAVNVIVWALIAGVLTDSCTVFTQSENFLKQSRLPKTIFVMRVLIRCFVNFAHNAILIPILFVVTGQSVAWTWLLIPPGLLLIAIAGYFTILLLGVLCTRFRDLPQVVQNLVQVAFFVTPILWPSSVIKERAPLVVELNPFAAYLHVVSEPIRGIVPSVQTYALAGGTCLLLASVGYLLFARFRGRLVYWL